MQEGKTMKRIFISFIVFSILVPVISEAKRESAPAPSKKALKNRFVRTC